MIHNIDRSGYFGASDSKYIVKKDGSPTNHNTETFKGFWSEKLGGASKSLNSTMIKVGNAYEHPILDAIDSDITKDGQIILEKYKLRVNYDGYKDGIIYEIKCHKAETEFDMSNYWWQCQIEMFVYKEMHKQWFLPPFKKLMLVSYPVYLDERNAIERGDYSNIVIDPKRWNMQEIVYDSVSVKGKYLPALKPLVRSLKKGKFPG